MSDMAYLAGIVDGEGSLQLNRVLSKHSARVNFMPRLLISNTNTALFQYLLDLKIGFTGFTKKKMNNPNAKTAHVASCGQDALRTLLPKMLPFMTVKKPQAELLIEVIKAKDEGTATDEWLESKKLEMHQLNSRGTGHYEKTRLAELVSKNAKKRDEHLAEAAKRRHELDTRTCLQCGVSLEGRHWHTKYCSNSCNLKHWRKLQKAKKENGAPDS